MKAIVEYQDIMHSGGGTYYVFIEGFEELRGRKEFPDYDDKNAKQKAQRYANKINKKIQKMNFIGDHKTHYHRY